MIRPRRDVEALAETSDIPVHEHRFVRDENGLIITTYPPKYPYVCECGAITHNPDTGVICDICTPRQTRKMGGSHAQPDHS